jgi:hypothetical protein
MVFIETPIFTEDCKVLLSDDEYARLQRELAQDRLSATSSRGPAACGRFASQPRAKASGAARE